MSNAEDLAHWPSRGNRRRLEEQWLERLERRGLATYLPGPPGVPPPRLSVAVGQFNTGAFWDCHETLEEVWLETPYPLRFFYHSMIKVAVGFHHVGRHNRHGARVKLSDGVRLLRLFPAEYMRVGTGRLLDEVTPWLERVSVEGNVSWAAMDGTARPVIHVMGG